MAGPLDAAAEVVVVSFIWAIGFASVNTYCIYEVLWKEEKERMKPGLLKKWTHAEFCELLLYDLIYGRKLSILDGMTVSSSSIIGYFCRGREGV